MAHVIFTRDFDYHPSDFSTISYKAGPDPQLVKRECADEAIDGGYGTEVATPSKPVEGAENGDNAAKSKRVAGKSTL